jgi:hypothetical protein
VVGALGQWGLVHARDRIKPSDLDPSLLMWGFRKRADRDALPERRIVVRFEFSDVPSTRTKFRIMWLILKRTGVDVCAKDPGFAVDLVMRGRIADFVAVYLGHARWRDLAGKALTIEGDGRLAQQSPRLDSARQGRGSRLPGGAPGGHPAGQSTGNDQRPLRPLTLALSRRHHDGVRLGHQADSEPAGARQ